MGLLEKAPFHASTHQHGHPCSVSVGSRRGTGGMRSGRRPGTLSAEFIDGNGNTLAEARVQEGGARSRIVGGVLEAG